ncbi:MAG TPA: hypoxanthine-guanine phosphoribosyltransferase [Gammaproteobacteria bacterium]|nr:hypoxanthine-guanine phosphoribosyltransferase [Gammaproteobacteria bacterium]
MPITSEEARAIASRAVCLYTDEQVQQALDRMAFDISHRIKNDNPIVLCVMNGGLIVTSELLKRFSFPLEVDYLHATRYGDATTGNSLEWLAKPRKNLKNRTVLVVDDILDVGKTLHEIMLFCSNKGARKAYSAVLTEKQHNRKSGVVKADFCALQVPDRYVFGYGMDYKHYLRNTTGIFAAAKCDE